MTRTSSSGLYVLPRLKFTLLAMAMAVIALLEGQAVLLNAQQMTVHGSSLLTGFAKGTISFAGLQLSILGAAAFLTLALPQDRISNVRARKLMSLTPMLCGIIILIEGLLILFAAAPITVGGDIDLPRILVAAFGAQLFFLGSMLASSQTFRERNTIGTSLGVMGSIGIISAGLWTASIAEPVVWTDLSEFHGRTVLAAGALLIAIGVSGLLLHYLEGRPLLRKPPLGSSLWTWAIVVLGALVALGGLIGLSVADDVRFATQGGLSSIVVTAAMFVLFILGMMASTASLSDENETAVESKARLAGLFLMLLLPFAVLI